MKYAYQEWPHSEDTVSQNSQQAERKIGTCNTMIKFKTDTTNK
jgi:hypothetical protein